MKKNSELNEVSYISQKAMMMMMMMMITTMIQLKITTMNDDNDYE